MKFSPDIMEMCDQQRIETGEEIWRSLTGSKAFQTEGAKPLFDF
jgi:hypothetical protein